LVFKPEINDLASESEGPVFPANENRCFALAGKIICKLKVQYLFFDSHGGDLLSVDDGTADFYAQISGLLLTNKV
jgi:hypothetical protein